MKIENFTLKEKSYLEALIKNKIDNTKRFIELEEIDLKKQDNNQEYIRFHQSLITIFKEEVDIYYSILKKLNLFTD